MAAIINTLFIIYSCKKNKDKHDLLYNLLVNKINAKIFIVYGDNNIQYEYLIQDKYLILKCSDNYEHLSSKTLKLINIAHKFKIKHLFKCDDDIIPNIKKMKELIQYVNDNTVDYLGIPCNVIKEFKGTDHYNKCTKPKLMFDTNYNIPKTVHKCIFAGGPMYYLNEKSINIINNSNIDTSRFFYEDVMIGYHLNKNDIYPYKWNIYINNTFSLDENIHNIKNKIKILYVYLHGRLGNILFQISVGYMLSNKYKMTLILISDNITDENKYILENFNSVEMKYVKGYNLFKETRCFDYNENIITKNENYLLYGYFQNKKYEFRENLYDYFINKDIIESIKPKYNFDNSYFIHVRRGDYLKETNKKMYQMDDDYYEKAIIYIKEHDENSKFYIISDDIEFCKKYEVFNDINKIFVELNTSETICFMTLCSGGICANSSFSGWGGKLNKSESKIIIVPKRWINIDYDYEIPFDYTVAL
jgi:hypothetical protein